MHIDLLRRLVVAVAVAVAVALSGCAGLWPEPPPPPRVFDLGPLPQSAPARTGAPVSLAWVRAPSWLDGPDILYRRTDQQAGALSAYANSQWAASPAELLAHRLQYHLGSQSAPADTRPARLEVELQAFEQVFESPERAYVHAAALARLQTRGAPARLHQLSVRLPADPGIRGATEVLPQAAEAMLEQLAQWLEEHTRDTSP